MKTGMKDEGSMKDACDLAHKARTAPANSMRYAPPSGPMKEPTRVNGVPMPAERGVSK